ncbi:SDR family oxidoreductase [Thermomonospora umbrina]|uniref:Short-subunit dehydrogenase n=1 Tax=Thermomonospora umbrina TaxID=111806 RepID=A0A3D9SU85_9ACTN|nr:SDR family oxidoreductase [Thermomonospora umbrina]REE97583.1 short-subunit dehydrogenase [Thermomonospora umbrina]
MTGLPGYEPGTPETFAAIGARAFLIAGATGPMAEPTVRLLTARGDRLLLTGRNSGRLDELRRRYGDQIATFTGDVARPAQAARAAGIAHRLFGGLDGLVHMIGGFAAGSASGTDPRVHERLLHANFLSAVVTTQAVLPLLGRPAWLVYIGSQAVADPPPALGAYAASKAALTTWARALARETEHGGLQVNVVQTASAGTPHGGPSPVRPPAGELRVVTPEQVAHVVGFLTSPNGLTGSVVPVPGRRAG